MWKLSPAEARSLTLLEFEVFTQFGIAAQKGDASLPFELMTPGEQQAVMMGGV